MKQAAATFCCANFRRELMSSCGRHHPIQLTAQLLLSVLALSTLLRAEQAAAAGFCGVVYGSADSQSTSAGSLLPQPSTLGGALLELSCRGPSDGTPDVRRHAGTDANGRFRLEASLGARGCTVLVEAGGRSGKAEPCDGSPVALLLARSAEEPRVSRHGCLDLKPLCVQSMSVSEGRQQPVDSAAELQEMLQLPHGGLKDEADLYQDDASYALAFMERDRQISNGTEERENFFNSHRRLKQQGCTDAILGNYFVEDRFIDYPGNDIAYYRYLTPEKCQAMCAANCACVGVTMDYPLGGRCFLKNRLARRGPLNGVTSFVRCPASGCTLPECTRPLVYQFQPYTEYVGAPVLRSAWGLTRDQCISLCQADCACARASLTGSATGPAKCWILGPGGLRRTSKDTFTWAYKTSTCAAGQNFIHERDTDFSGANLKYIVPLSFAGCKSACQFSCACLGFVHRDDSQQCYLKKEIGYKKGGAVEVQGYVRTPDCTPDGRLTSYTLEQGVAYEGNSLGDGIRGISAQDCLDLCTSDCQCAGVTVDGEYGCQLKHQLTNRKETGGAASWTRVGGNYAAGENPWSTNMRTLASPGAIGIHIALTYKGNLLLLDRTYITAWDFNTSNPQLRLPNSMRSIGGEYNPYTGNVRSLNTLTNVFCSSGQTMADGTVAVLAGTDNGLKGVRLFEPSTDSSTDFQHPDDLLVARWYPTSQILPNGQIIVVGGSRTIAVRNSPTLNVPSIEYWPRGPRDQQLFHLEFLVDTLPDNLYPILHLLPSSRLLILANKKGILYDWTRDVVTKTLPDMPGGPRCYPFAAASVLLPLNPKNGYTASVLVCGGGNTNQWGYLDKTAVAQATCVRSCPECRDPSWTTEKLAFPRSIPNLVIIPSGKVVIVNGAGRGFMQSSPWTMSDPVMTPEYYTPWGLLGARISTAPVSSHIPRMYHSSASLLPDARVFLSGSQPNDFYTVKGPFPAEFRGEVFVPSYNNRVARPLLYPTDENLAADYGEEFEVEGATARGVTARHLRFVVINPGFVTHALSMGQRMIVLLTREVTVNRDGSFKARLVAPPNANIAPPGYYWLFVTRDSQPCTKAIPVHFGLYNVKYR